MNNGVKCLAEGHAQGFSALLTTDCIIILPFRASASSPHHAVVKVEGARGGAVAALQSGLAGLVLRTGLWPMLVPHPMGQALAPWAAPCRPGLVSCAPLEQSPCHHAPSPGSWSPPILCALCSSEAATPTVPALWVSPCPGLCLSFRLRHSRLWDQTGGFLSAGVAGEPLLQ